jgi:asparagine synthase (glutamine-hydrolysing)
MCGIIAAFNVHISNKLKSRGLRSIEHRGPDATGQWVSSSNPKVWIGHRRLSIVDLSDAGRQPMHTENKKIWLVCNGEIYNYPGLRSSLEGLGHTFYSNSDNEVILHAYEEWGDQCVDYLEGMFAFALWDGENQRLLAARDRVGIKPLYYTEIEEQGLILASEASAILPLLKYKPEPEPMALAYVMTLGYVPSPWSIWRGVYKLEPGHLLIWQAQTGVKRRRYWEPPRYIDPAAKQNLEEWQGLFETVLREHLLSDVPIGLFLSGGLDSSSVAAGLRGLDRSVQAITVSYPGSPHDESPIAADVAKHLSLPHEIIPLQIDDVNRLIRHVTAAFDEPQGYSALLSMYLISQVASQDFKVILAGDGGDETFGGYTWYRNLNDGIRRRSQWIRRALRPLVRRNASPETRQRASHHFSRASLLHRHAWRLYPRFLPEEAEALLDPMGLRFGDEEMLAPLRKHLEPTLPLQRALQRVDLMTFCTDSILAKVDRASMAHSLEVRVPFLDRRIVEWALTRPLEAGELVENKPLLRDYLRSRVPASVLEHPKQGFSLRVLDEFDRDAALELIRHGWWVRDGWWSSDWDRLLQPGVPYRDGRIWNLLMLTQWADVWLGKKVKEDA